MIKIKLTTLILLSCFSISFAQSFKKNKIKTTYEQFPYVPILDSTVTYNSTSSIEFHGCKRKENPDYMLYGTPFRSFTHQNNWNQETELFTATLPLVSDVSEFEIKNKDKKLLFYRVFNTFYTPNTASPIVEKATTLSLKQSGEISDHFSRMAIHTNRIIYVSIMALKKGDNIDDVKAACQASLDAVNAYNKKDPNTSELMKKAIDMNEKILTEADFKSKKSRINKKVADPVLRNLAQLKMLNGDFEESIKLCNEYNTKVGGFKGSTIASFIGRNELLIENKKIEKGEPHTSFSGYEFPNGEVETPELSTEVDQLSLSAIKPLLYGSWLVTNNSDAAKKDNIMHFNTKGVVIEQSGQWEDATFTEGIFWKLNGNTSGDKNIITCFDKEKFADIEKNQDDLNFFKIEHISRDKLILNSYRLKILDDSEVSYSSTKSNAKIGGFSVGSMKSNKFQVTEIGEIRMDRIQIRE